MPQDDDKQQDEDEPRQVAAVIAVCAPRLPSAVRTQCVDQGTERDHDALRDSCFASCVQAGGRAYCRLLVLILAQHANVEAMRRGSAAAAQAKAMQDVLVLEPKWVRS